MRRPAICAFTTADGLAAAEEDVANDDPLLALQRPRLLVRPLAQGARQGLVSRAGSGIL